MYTGICRYVVTPEVLSLNSRVSLLEIWTLKWEVWSADSRWWQIGIRFWILGEKL